MADVLADEVVARSGRKRRQIEKIEDREEDIGEKYKSARTGEATPSSVKKTPMRTGEGPARRRLADSGLPVSVVLIADSIDEISIQAMADSGSGPAADVHVLALAAGPEVVPPAGSPPAPALDEDSMRRAARAAGGSLVRVTPDSSDVQRLNGRIESSIASAPVQEGERWKDAGYYLLPLLAACFLLFFRPGGAVALNR